MIGSALKVVATAENGNKFESAATAKVGVYSFDITSAKATKVNEITVTFADAVEAKNVTFVVKKGETTVATEAVKATDWSDKDVVAIKTTANMTDGTYTVTATDSETKATDSADFEVTKQHVEEIVILNETALTNRSTELDKAHKEAYAYYDVLDQYGQSMRASTSIQWSGSAKITADKANGKLTMKKNSDEAWVFNDKIYITGVYVKAGVSKSATLTVGTEQSLNSIEMKGFLKKGTSDIIQDLPADFKTGAYYLLFHSLDQNGCPLKAGEVGKEDVTFVPDNVLVVKELTEFPKNVITVEGTEYDAVFVEPGINVAKGGNVTVTAIANKTGEKTNLNFMVGDDRVVVSFKLGAPTGIVADGDQNVPIPFEATDDKGGKLTNFRALAKQEIFNTLSFNTSEGTLRLAEQNDGTAKLTWSDSDAYSIGTFDKDGKFSSPWANANTTDGIDRPISLSVVVVGGEPNNEMLYVQDKRRPNAISDVHMNEVYVEGAEIEFNLTADKDTDDFKFIDQYETVIGTDWGDDNGFFEAAANKELKGIDFADYHFGIRIENTGTGYVVLDGNNTYAYTTADTKKAIIEFGGVASYDTTTNIKSAAVGEGFKFEIVKFKENAGDEAVIYNPTDWEAVSPTKFKGLAVVDITQVKNFQVGDLNKFYTGKLSITGDKIIAKNMLPNLKDENYAATASSAAVQGQRGIYSEDDGYQQEVKVTGTYNGKPVSIPGNYFTIATTKKSLKDTNNDDKFDKIDTIYLSNLYDKTTANGVAKDGEDEVVATISKIYDNYGFWTWTEKDGLHTDANTNATEANIALDKGKTTEMAAAANAAGLPEGVTVTKDTVAGWTTNEAPKYNAAKTDVENKQTAYEGTQTAVDTAASNIAFVGLTDDQLNEVAFMKTQVKADTNPTAVPTLPWAYCTAGTDERTLAEDAVKAHINVLKTKAAVDALNLPGTALAELNETVAKVETGEITATPGDYKDATLKAQKATVNAYIGALLVEIEADDDLDGLTYSEWAALRTYRDTLKKDSTTVAATDAPIVAMKLDTKENAQAVVYLNAWIDMLKAEDDLENAQEALQIAEAAVAAKNMSDTIDGYKATNAAGTLAHGGVYDTAKAPIKYSDQKPYAEKIEGLKETYIFKPIGTNIYSFDDTTNSTKAYLKTFGGDLKVVDQYGVEMKDAVLEYTVSNATENKDGYAENNFKVSRNGGAAPTIKGAELGDTFDLVVSVKGSTLKKTAKVTVGADEMASIENNINNYTLKTVGLKAILEEQRKAGLQ